MLAVVLAVQLGRAYGHAAVANPAGRHYKAQPYCQWCMGEKKEDGSNPPGTVNHDARLSSPCMGTRRGDGTTPASYWGDYSNVAGNFDMQTYAPGQAFDAWIAMNANHQGEAQWQFCPHSEAETEECFRRNVVKNWERVNCHFNDCDAAPHAHNKPYKEVVTLPSNLPSGPGTLRWYWVCKETVEVFTSCIDVNIAGGDESGTRRDPVDTRPDPILDASCAVDGEDCSASGCCADTSKTCYKKDEYWSMCRSDCTPGVWDGDPEQYRTPWSCDVVRSGSLLGGTFISGAERQASAPEGRAITAVAATSALLAAWLQ